MSVRLVAHGRWGRWLPLTVLALATCNMEPPVSADLALVGFHVIPMTQDTVLANHTVLISGSRITVVAPASSLRLSVETPVIEGNGRYLMPGLVESHVHLRTPAVLDLYLSQGFTTLRNMNGAFGDPLTWARDIEEGHLVGPTLINASPVLAWKNPSRTLPGRGPIDTFDTLKSVLHEIHASGFASVKVLEFPREAFDTLMAESRRLGLPVTGHPPITSSGDPSQDMTLDEVLGSGLSVVEHLDELIYDGLPEGSRDSASVASLADRVARSGVAVTTLTGMTLQIGEGLGNDSAFLSPVRLARVLKYGGPGDVELVRDLPRLWRENGFEAVDPELLKLVTRSLHRAGVPLLVGTDSHSPIAVGGESAIEEVHFLIQAGLSPFEAIAAMTSTPARVFGAVGEWGTVQSGARADLLVLDANPLEGAEALESQGDVVLRGRWIDRQELAAMRARAEEQVLFCRAPSCD